MMLTTTHPQWDEYAGRPEQALATTGCNAHRGGPEHESMLAILATFDVELTASLAYFRIHGGHCDCEILLNVVGSEVPCTGPPEECFRCRHWITDSRGRLLARDTFDADERAYIERLAV